MVRKQIYIEDRQEALLKRLSERLGVPEAELIRRGIDRCAQVEVSRERRLKAWQGIKRYILKHRMAKPGVAAPRTWTREELYDERWDRRHGR